MSKKKVVTVKIPVRFTYSVYKFEAGKTEFITTLNVTARPNQTELEKEYKCKIILVKESAEYHIYTMPISDFIKNATKTINVDADAQEV